MNNTHPIGKSAFKNLAYVVVFFNETSKTEMISEDKGKIIEIGDDWVTLEIPKNTCALSHKLRIHIIRRHDTKRLMRGQLNAPIPFSISILGTVTEFIATSSQIAEIKFQFTQFSKDEWAKFMEKWSTLQGVVDMQFRKIKE